MQNASDEFRRLSVSDVRPVRADIFIDFYKNYVSGLPGLQDWDKYSYVDYSYRLMNVEWVREVHEYSSVSMAMADFTLDNHDGWLTPNGTSVLASYILPNRPVKIYSGFGSEVIQSFVGLTDGMPVINEKERTVTFHAVDFMSILMKKPLDQTSMYIGKRTDEIIRDLLNNEGLLDAQISLDLGLNLIPFAYMKKGEILGDVMFKLMEAEGGRLFMDESGMITFKNRNNYDNTVRTQLSPSVNIKSTVPTTSQELINVVVVKGKIREVQPNQPYGELTAPVQVGAGASVDIWVEFPDLVTTITDPVKLSSAVTSYFDARMFEDGSGEEYTSITLTDSDHFGTSGKFTFTNSGANAGWVVSMKIFATPAVVTQDVYVREEDETSVLNYGERILEIENDFFGDSDNTQSKALMTLRSLATVGEVREMEIKGDMSLSLEDIVQVHLFGVDKNYRIIKIINGLNAGGGYRQIIRLSKEIDDESYFMIESSEIWGTDLIAP